MRPCSAFLTTFPLFILSSFLSSAQPEGVRVQKKNAWIETISYNAQSTPKSDDGSSYYYLLLDEQENTTVQEDYRHHAYVILTSEGVQQMSDLSFDFDPAYQTLTLHEIKVLRGNSVINQLSKNINIIQREQSMDRHLYDGTKTAVFNLRDIRIGDIVEFSYTRKGLNPVHQGHISRTFYFDFYQSIDKYFRKLILPSTKGVQIQNIGSDVPAPLITHQENEVHYQWTIDKIKGISSDSGTPTWYNDTRGVMISDFPSWTEVGEWAKQLFVLNQEQIKRIKDDVAVTFGATDQKEYVLKVIRFVQDEVRYLGFENGINSHKPYAPTQVYEQRFGDCKDKSLLLTTLLQARGVEAYPVLVNTSLKQSLDERLPAGNIFDHCVAKIILEGDTLYVDPTISSQGGGIGNIHFPDYRRGLVIDHDITGLDTLPEPESPSTTEVQNFELLAVGGEAMLTIRSSYRGSDADSYRSYFASNSINEISKYYREYYANLYPDITTWNELTFTDDRQANVFNVEEKYKIPTFWKPLEGQDGKIYCTLQPQTIASYFNVPKNIQQHKSPYHLSYPVDFYHNIHVKLPEEWTINPVDEIIENDYYQYERAVKKSGNEITLLTHYKTKRDHIPADRISSYVSDHGKMYDNLVYQLSYDTNVAQARNPWAGAIMTIVALLAGVYMMFMLYHRYDPAPARYMVTGLPIGGWLILVGIGLIISPLRLLYDFVTNPILISGDGWMAFLASKQYELFTFVVFTHVYNILKLLFSVLLVVLFVQRRSSFPRLMIIQLSSSLVVLTTDELVAQSVSTDGTSVDFQEIGRLIFACIIWIPYLLVSQRVKDTFVTRSDSHGGAEPHDPEYEDAIPAGGEQDSTVYQQR